MSILLLNPKKKHCKNIVAYNPNTWAEWDTKVNAICNTTGAQLLPLTASYARIRQTLTYFKNSTNYGILFSTLSCTLTTAAIIDPNNNINATPVPIPMTIGNQILKLTTLASITTNCFYIYIAQQTTGTQITLNNIRVFELPVGSQIAWDFNNLTSDQLNSRYPF